MTRSSFQKLASSRIIHLDGATGTELIRRGLPAGASPELWVLEHPDALISAQQAYVDAGTELLLTCTFGGNPVKLAEFGRRENTFEINRDLARISKSAFPDKLVFGDISSTGLLVEPFGPLPFDEAVAIYREQVSGLLAGGVDGFTVETMMDLQETRAALIAIRELAPDLPAMVTMTFDSSGRSLTGIDPVAALVTLQALGADAFGCNCSTGPEEMARIISTIKPYAKIPLIAKPNAGLPHLEGDKTVFELEPEPFAVAASLLADAGANLIGGCCGTGPAHIAALARALKGKAAQPVSCQYPGVIASGTRVRRLAQGEPFTLIGERINPTGKKALQAELREGKFHMVREFAVSQSEAGAKVLDVNFGLAGIDETAMMRQGISEIVKVTDLPLCIDSTSPETVEAALRLYPGRALLNSISAEEARLTQVLPIAAKYGAMLILLPLTDEGIPATADARMDAVKTILSACAAYGYTPEECAVDALIMTISADPAAAVTALDFIGACKARNWNCVCGLSNVSFGLPNRPAVNSVFLNLAAARGLNMAIANPGATGIAASIPAIDALLGNDPGLRNYLAANANVTASAGSVPAPAAADIPPEQQLRDAVLNGRKDEIPAKVQKVLERSVSPGVIVNEILIPAITEVGNRFERKEFFLPQLMHSAEAMEHAMAQLMPLLEASGATGDGPVFVLATVKGDIHDIGKNIFAMLLRNHGFRVIDLGKDVPAEVILDTAEKEHAAIVGLSALMTTTMPQMRNVLALMKQRGMKIPVMVGGAAVDEEFAKSIGAIYGADAMTSVRKALALVASGK